MEVLIKYNPYTVMTEIIADNSPIDFNSTMGFVPDKRLQEWIEPRPQSNWKGIFKEIKLYFNVDSLDIRFHGTKYDFEDMEYARKKYGVSLFKAVNLIHANEVESREMNPEVKLIELSKLYEELQKGPIEDFKTEDIRRNFESALSADFEIVITATMSSGKSTLLNAFMGKDLLPQRQQACTALLSRIRDEKGLADFRLTCDKCDGTPWYDNVCATKEIVAEVNDEKDPNDPRREKPLAGKVLIEGPFHRIHSDQLHTVFVDTPGGNNAMNKEHEKYMEQAINDENRSLILFVLDTAALSTNDADEILGKIAQAMQDRSSGKQSSDRFIFVWNKVDIVNPSQETFDSFLKNSILPFLEERGIINPNIFAVSAQTAVLLRTAVKGREMSMDDQEQLYELTTKMLGESYQLVNYSSVSDEYLNKYHERQGELSNKIEAEAEANNFSIRLDKYKARIGVKRYDVEYTESQAKLAELNCGILAIEDAIQQYLNKYAIAIKLETVQKAFMRKVRERHMIDAAMSNLAKSEKDMEAARKEIQEKKKKLDKGHELEHHKKKLTGIGVSGDIKSSVAQKRADAEKKLSKFINMIKAASEDGKLKEKQAKRMLETFNSDMKDDIDEFTNSVRNEINKECTKKCNAIIDEYEAYIQELDGEGMFSFAGLRVKELQAFDAFKTTSVKMNDYIEKREKTHVEKVKDGQEYKKVRDRTDYVKKPLLRRIGSFLTGKSTYEYVTTPVYDWVDKYKWVDVTTTEIYVNVEKIVRGEVARAGTYVSKVARQMLEQMDGEIQGIKEHAEEKLDSMEAFLKGLLAEYEVKLSNSEQLKREVEKNAQNLQWMEWFINRMDKLLEI